MKRTLFIIAVGLFIFSACEKIEKYSNEQRDALNKLSGSYHAYVGKEMISAVISFTSRYEMPLPVSEGKNVVYYLHGECLFWDYNYYIPDKGYIPCYYSISEKADELSLYYKGGDDNRRLLRTYGLRIETTDVFTLNDNGRIIRFQKIK